jgi:hypothetical protein
LGAQHPEMPQKPTPKPDNPEQFKRFIETAHEVEVDEDPKALERALDRVLRPKTQPESPKK